MEEIQQMVRRELGPGTVVVTSPDILRAFEDHAGDEAALRQATEAAIPSLPPETRQSLQWGFHIEMEDVDLPLRKKKRGLEPGQLPTEEVLQRVSAEARTALADHRELLDDRWALIRALPDMPERTRRAAEEFLGKTTEPVPAASMLPEDALREIERAKARGYFEKPGAPFGTQLLAAIYQSELAANQAATGRHHTPSATQGQVFYSRLEDHIAIHPMLPTVPANYIEAGSRNYVVPSKDSSSQIIAVPLT